MRDIRTLNLANQIIDELRERNVEPTRLRVLAACTDMGMDSDQAQAVADVIERRKTEPTQ
jgi:hypothetical protein